MTFPSTVSAQRMTRAQCDFGSFGRRCRQCVGTDVAVAVDANERKDIVERDSAEADKSAEEHRFEEIVAFEDVGRVELFDALCFFRGAIACRV